MSLSSSVVVAPSAVPRAGAPLRNVAAFTKLPIRRRSVAGAQVRKLASPVVASASSASGNDDLESTRKNMRTVFDVDRWVVHRSTDRYFRHMVGIFQSRVLTGLFKPLVYCELLSVAVCAYGEAFKAAALPAFMPALDSKIKELFGMTSFALALLLVFRTNASYARWDEGRKMWGMVLNRTRDICRLALTWIDDEQRELRSMMLRWAPAFGKALMCHLRKGEDLAQELKGLLLPHEIDGVLKATHRPNYIIQVLSQIVRSAGLPLAATLKMEEDLTAFEDNMGGCERLLRTPIPLFYTRHTSRFLMIWLTCLPFALYPTCGWTTVPFTFLISFLLLGIDKIGVSIEEPFSILALEVISNTALANVRELAAMHRSTVAAANGNSNGNGGAKAKPDDVSAATMVALAGVTA